MGSARGAECKGNALRRSLKGLVLPKPKGAVPLIGLWRSAGRCSPVSRCSTGQPRPRHRGAPGLVPSAGQQRRPNPYEDGRSILLQFLIFLRSPPHLSLAFCPPLLSLLSHGKKKSSRTLTLSPSFFLPFETHEDRPGPAVFRQRRFQLRFSCHSGRKGQIAGEGKDLLIKPHLLCSTVLVSGSLPPDSLSGGLAPREDHWERWASARAAPQPSPKQENWEFFID